VDYSTPLNFKPTMPFIYATDLDFRPANPEYLLLSRLDFLSKHRKIYSYMRR
jgi:hypothetical protein